MFLVCLIVVLFCFVHRIFLFSKRVSYCFVLFSMVPRFSGNLFVSLKIVCNSFSGKSPFKPKKAAFRVIEALPLASCSPLPGQCQSG